VAKLSMAKGGTFDHAAFEARVRGGKSLNEALRKGERPIGTSVGFERYCAANPEWWAEFKPIVEANSAAAKARATAHSFEGKTHCRNGHLLVESMGIKKSNGTRYCRFCNRITVRRGVALSPGKIEEIARAFVTGMSGKQITRSVGGRKPLVTLRSLRRLKMERPEIAQLQFLHGSVQARFNLSSRQAVVRVDPAQFDRIPRDAPAPSSAIEVYVPRDDDVEWLYSLTPRYLPKHARDEIVGNIFLELSERRVNRAGVPACAKNMVRAYNRENPMQVYGDIRAPLPLDAPAYLDGTMSRVEIVSEGLW